MTNSQIATSLTMVGNYSLDSWIPLNEVTHILTTQAVRVVINPAYFRYKFSSDGILRIVKGNQNSDGSFTTTTGETDPTKFKATQFISFSMIHGFVRTVDRSQTPLLFTQRRDFA